jgi:hypothetical protein
MKKVYSTVFLIIGLFAFVNGQDLTLDHPTLDYSGPSNQPLSAELTIVNSSGMTLDVVAEDYQRNMVPGHSTFFCWYVCYDTVTTLSPDSIRLAPGASTNSFIDHVVSNGIAGHDDITYRFYDQNGNSDTLTVTMNYDFMPVGVFEISSTNGSFNFSGPNPANSTTMINYYINGSRNAKLVVTNMLGSKVKEIPLAKDQNSLTLSVRDLKSGIYIYSLFVDGKMTSSKKLVVTQR